jgi:hypothetical protein
LRLNARRPLLRVTTVGVACLFEHAVPDVRRAYYYALAVVRAPISLAVGLYKNKNKHLNKKTRVRQPLFSLGATLSAVCFTLIT